MGQFQHLIIVGCGRSGTTMLQQALNRHPNILIPPETGYFIDVLGHTRRGQCRHFQQINRDVGSSRVDLQACKLEYSIVSPK